MHNEFIIVTGGASRVGGEISKFLAKIGYNIILHYNSSYNEAILIQEIIETSYQKKCILYKADFNHYQEYKEMISFLEEALEPTQGIIIGLINNSSLFKRQSFNDLDHDSFETNINISFKAPLFIIQSFIDYITKRPEAYKYLDYFIVNILDNQIKMPAKNFFMYSLLKKNLHEIMISLTHTHKDFIRINSLCPGILMHDIYQTKEFIESTIQNSAKNIAPSINNFLQSIQHIITSDFLYGQTIYIDRKTPN